MAKQISILCVHGVGHKESDLAWQTQWEQAIQQDILAWNPDANATIAYLPYDDLFAKANLGFFTYAAAMGKLLASGIVHGIGDLFTRSRGLFDFPDQVRWTAGMIAQWSVSDPLKQSLRDRVAQSINENEFDVIAAHSLGSLICYDTFRLNPRLIDGKTFLSFGSQIGNPFVRDCFAGRIEPLPAARQWYHLYNPQDHVLTAEIRLTSDNFVEIGTDFDIPNDPLNHDALWYFNNANTKARVWRDLAGTSEPTTLTRSLRAFSKASAKPRRRALLVGINDYPDPANRLEGCVNDVFLISATLQECGFRPQDIRIVLNDRATTDGIMDRLHWLLDDLCADDERVLFYSGHGAKIPAYGPTDEVDHENECLVPWDFDWTPEHAITDKQFLQLYSQIPYDARFVAIFDCCHSGGMTRDGGLRPRGISPPDDIRYRALRWNATAAMWEQRHLIVPNETLKHSPAGPDYLGPDGVTHRLGRAIPLRTLPRNAYDARREALRHKGPYLPILMEACQENQLAYEYRHGATSYGAYTYCLADILRSMHLRRATPTFRQLNTLAAARLRAMKYDQNPSLVGPSKILSHRIPFSIKNKPTNKKPTRARLRP